MIEFWNDRYSKEVYAYGTAPNEYLKQAIIQYNLAGSMLLPAEGEGRNAVFAAEKGLHVTAFDISEEGKKKALALARLKNVDMEYHVGDLDKLGFKENTFDSLALIYAHFPTPIKSMYHKHLAKLLKPNGLVILEGFSKSNLEQVKLNPGIGGPKNKDMLFSKVEIEQDFENFEILELEEKMIDLEEGEFHKGQGAVIRFIGRKLPK